MREGKKFKNDNNEQILEHTETYEDDDSDEETDADAICSFHRTVPDEVPLKKRNIPESKKRLNDAIAADKECERVVANWVEYKVKWKKNHNEKN